MRIYYSWKVIFTFLTLSNSISQASSADIDTFKTKAAFSRGKTKVLLSTAVAVMTKPNQSASDNIFWLNLLFYPFPVRKIDIKEIERGNILTLNERLVKSHRVEDLVIVQLTINKSYHVLQMDMTIRKHLCSVATTISAITNKTEIKDAIQEFSFDGQNLTIKANGSHPSDYLKENFTWNFNLKLPVYKAHFDPPL